MKILFSRDNLNISKQSSLRLPYPCNHKNGYKTEITKKKKKKTGKNQQLFSSNLLLAPETREQIESAISPPLIEESSCSHNEHVKNSTLPSPSPPPIPKRNTIENQRARALSLLHVPG